MHVISVMPSRNAFLTSISLILYTVYRPVQVLRELYVQQQRFAQKERACVLLFMAHPIKATLKYCISKPRDECLTLRVPSQHLLDPRACAGYLVSDLASTNADPDVVALLKQRQRQAASSPACSAIAGDATSAAASPASAVNGGSMPSPSPMLAGTAAPAESRRRQLRKAWLHEAFDTASGTCRFCGGRITSPNTSIKKKHLLNPRACRSVGGEGRGRVNVCSGGHLDQEAGQPCELRAWDLVFGLMT